jgi:hypothetical protein
VETVNKQRHKDLMNIISEVGVVGIYQILIIYSLLKDKQNVDD